MNKVIRDLVVFFKKRLKKLKLKNLPLHEPILTYDDQKILSKCIKSGYVSSIGDYVKLFEQKLKKFTKSKFVITTVNGTAGLQIALKLIGLKKNEEVLVPALSFIAAPNSVIYNHGIPHFVDVEKNHFGVHPKKLENYLKNNTLKRNQLCINKKTQRVIRAIIIVHVFGHSAEIKGLIKIAKKYNIKIIEDAAEALGSFNNKKHLGTFGDVGVISFNGNKIITTGGGGAILTNNKLMAEKAYKLTTTFRKKHKWEYIHDELGYNFRLPNINAALGISQMKKLKKYINSKRKLFKLYENFFINYNKFFSLVKEPKNCKSNYWLQTIILNKIFSSKKNHILNEFHKHGILIRPVWKSLHKQKFLKKYPKMNLNNTKDLEKRIINLPSSSYLF